MISSNRLPEREDPAMSMTRRKLGALAAGLAGASVAAHIERRAFGAPSNAEQGVFAAQVDESTLVIADNLAAHWRTLDPAFFYEASPCSAMHLIYDTLYHAPNGEQPDDIQPLLASGMPEFSEDYLTATIRLRDDVVFQNSGNRMTAGDVIFSWNRLKHVGLSGSYLADTYWSAIEALDDFTLQLTLPSPNADLAAILVAPMLSITEKSAVESMGGTDAEPSTEEDSPELQANLAAKEEIDRASVGSGPFRVVKWDVNSEVILERSDISWGPVPTIERVIYRNTLDTNAQLQSAQIGEADVAMNVTMESLAGLGDDVKVLSGRTLTIQYLAFNLREEFGGPVANRQVRHTIAHAIDYQGIIDGILLGHAVRPATALPIPLEGSEAALTLALPSDVDRAQQLWDESGVGPATIQIDYAADVTGRGGVDLQRLATKLQADLQRIDGLTVRLAPMPNSQRSARYRSGEFQITLSGWVPDFPGVDAYVTPFFHSEGSAARRIGFADAELDALIVEAAAEQDQDVRATRYVDIQRRAIAECPYIALYQPDDIKVARTEVEGIQVHPVYQLQLRQMSKTS
jgi:peptide/nickel transport system substrate-binding protein